MRKPSSHRLARAVFGAASRVLILSSTEALPIARAVQSELATPSIEPTIWDQARFSGWLLKDILTKMAEYTFVVAILSPDDLVVSRKTRALGPRDNLILELGMALAMNGISRTIVLYPKSHSFKIPTDLGGLLLNEYVIRSDDNWRAAVAPACSDILANIEAQLRGGMAMTGTLFYRAVASLNDRLVRSSRRRPDILIGVNHGGAILGGMLYYLHRQLFHFMILWMDVNSSLRTRPQRLGDAKLELQSLVRQLEADGKTQPLIFVVDDTLRSGRAMTPAVEIIKEVVPNAILRIGVILFRPDMAETYDPATLSAHVYTPDPRSVPFACYDRIFYE